MKRGGQAKVTKAGGRGIERNINLIHEGEFVVVVSTSVIIQSRSLKIPGVETIPSGSCSSVRNG